MKFFSVLVFLVAVTCSTTMAFTTSDLPSRSLVPINRQEFDLYANSRRLIERLVENLRNAAKEAMDAINRFTAGIQDEAKIIQEKLMNDVQKLRERVANALESLRNRLIDSGVAVVDCIASHNSDASTLFNATVTKAKSCVEERVSDVGNQISGLRALADNAVEYGGKALDDMRKCTEENVNIIATGSCLGSVAVQTEMKALVFATQSGLTIGRINLSIATLPAALEVCAGSQLVESGLATARILMDIGTCSASSVFSTMTGDSSFQNTAGWRS